jgi:hypothetical protein
MLGTVLDISGQSPLLLARESLALVRDGWRARARITAAIGPRRLACDVLAQAVTLWGFVSLISVLQIARAASLRPDAAELSYLGLLVCAIALALLGYDRIAGISGLAWIAVLYLAIFHHQQRGVGAWRATPVEHEISLIFLPLCGYATMILAPRSRSRHPIRVLCFASTLMWMMALPSLPSTWVAPSTLILLVVLAVGLLRLATDPRLAIACALVLGSGELARWTIGARTMTSAPLTWILATAPLLLILSMARLYTVRRQLPR